MSAPRHPPPSGPAPLQQPPALAAVNAAPKAPGKPAAKQKQAPAAPRSQATSPAPDEPMSDDETAVVTGTGQRSATGEASASSSASVVVHSLRINVPLAPTDTLDGNSFNYADLTRLHTERIRQTQRIHPATDTTAGTTSNATSVVPLTDLQPTHVDDESDNAKSKSRSVSKGKRKDTGDGLGGTSNKKARQIDPEDEYDVEDDFIDDSDMFVDSVGFAQDMPHWDYGFFVWHGPVESFFEQESEMAKASKVAKDRIGSSTASVIVSRPAKHGDAAASSISTLSSAPSASAVSAKTASLESTSKLQKPSASASTAGKSATETNASKSARSSKIKPAAASTKAVPATGSLSQGTVSTSTAVHSAGTALKVSDSQGSASTAVSKLTTKTAAPSKPTVPAKPPKMSSVSAATPPTTGALAASSQHTTAASKPASVTDSSRATEAEKPKKPAMGPPASAAAASSSAASAPSTTAAMGAASPAATPGMLPTSASAPAPSAGPSSAAAVDKDMESLPLPVFDRLERLRQVAATKSFADKKQFPGSLVALLRDAVWEAMDLHVHDDAFYACLAKILPYNITLLRKIVLKLVFPERMRTVKLEINQLYEDMRAVIERDVALQQPGQPDQNAQTDDDDQSTRSKFKWDDDLRALTWNILCMEWELADLDNLNTILNNNKARFIEGTVRKAVYSKMCSFWPPTWMDTNLISREYSAFKKRVNRLYARVPASDKIEIAGYKIRRDPFAKITVVRGKGSKPLGMSPEKDGEGDPDGDHDGSNSMASAALPTPANKSTAQPSIAGTIPASLAVGASPAPTPGASIATEAGRLLAESQLGRIASAPASHVPTVASDTMFATAPPATPTPLPRAGGSTLSGASLTSPSGLADHASQALYQQQQPQHHTLATTTNTAAGMHAPPLQAHVGQAPVLPIATIYPGSSLTDQNVRHSTNGGHSSNVIVLD